MATIGLGIITRNKDIEGLKRALDTVIDHVDSVYITVADKEKPSKEMEDYAASIHADLSFFEWCDDFAAARNFNFSRIGEDWMTWMDTDDEVEGMEKAREFLGSLAPNMHFVLCTYNYAFMPNGSVSTKHPKERFMRNNGMFTWKGKLHETCVSDAKHAGVEFSGVVWNHRTDADHTDESSVRNVRIIENELEEQIQAGKVDPRTVFNLGMAYASVAQRTESAQDWGNTLRAFLRYTKMGEWDTHMLMAWKYIGLAHLQMGQPILARDAALQCIGLKPQYKDGYNLLAQAFEKMNKLEEAVVAYEIGLTSADNEYASDIATTVLGPCVGLASCYARMGNRMKALYYIREAKKVVGESHEFLNMLEAEIVKLDELFERSKSEVERIKGLPRNDQQAAFNTLPSEIKSFPAVALWRKQQDWASAPPSGRDVVIYTGMGWEMWNPESAKTGIGGSEEAVIYLARELSALGWKVKVYGNHGTEPKDYDGVTYVPFWEWSPKEETDIFISWRDASIFDMDIRARKRYLWLHDTNAEADLSESRLEKIDKVIVLSKYHRSLYPNKPDEKFMLSANGIVPEQFNIDVPRNPKKCVYASAPDRGLHCLLQMWPKIREQVPDAELYWAYGWNTFDLAAASNPQLQVLKNEIQMMLRQPGVTELGRIGHKEVAKLMMSSALWLYPTMFTEIFPVHGDTLIETSRGAVPIKKLVGKKDVFVYSWNQDKRLIELSRVLWCGRTRKDAEVVRVDMKYGVGRNAKKTCSLTLTPDHPVMMRDGSWKPAGELLMGDRVMPMNRVKNGWGDGYDLLVAGYEASEAAHRIACRYHTTELQGKDVDHIDGDVSNNDPSNLQALSRSEHWKKTWAAKSIEERKAWAKGVTGNIRRHEKKLGKNAISEERRKAAKVRWSKRLGDNHVVTKVSRAPNADVFCMEVEPNHNFVANSVVVHNCITAIKAQASGAMPITTNVAALEETVQDGIKFDVKDIYYNEEAQDKFIAATVKALQNPPDHEAIKAKATGRWSWSSVAKQWDNEFSR